MAKQVAQAAAAEMTAKGLGLTIAVVDSGPPITAILAADELACAGLDFLARLQTAHYVEGRRIADFTVLLDLAVALGLNADAFALAFQRLDGAATQAHIAESRALLARVGGQGFPTMAIEIDGQFATVDIGHFLGRPEAWRTWFSKTQRPRQPGCTASCTSRKAISKTPSIGMTNPVGTSAAGAVWTKSWPVSRPASMQATHRFQPDQEELG